ncbi:MAG TPA: hypothetical protein VM779_10305 [Thermoanaerobaculia bacterium]|nr:hypothetical protein [Thermoanaerobaculia bacterium]
MGSDRRRSLILLRRAVRVDGRRVIAQFLRQPGRAAVITFPTHADARRAASRLLVQLRLTRSDEEWDDQLVFRVELLRAYNALADAMEPEGDDDR